jgi:hypothetical protein
MYYVTDPEQRIEGQEAMAFEWGYRLPDGSYRPASVRTIQNAKSTGLIKPEPVPRSPGRPVDSIVAQSLWAAQSHAWTKDVEASQENGRLGGRPKTECGHGSNVHARSGMTLASVAPSR